MYARSDLNIISELTSRSNEIGTKIHKRILRKVVFVCVGHRQTLGMIRQEVVAMESDPALLLKVNTTTAKYRKKSGFNGNGNLDGLNPNVSTHRHL